MAEYPKREMLIGGKWISREGAAVIDPADGSVIETPFGGVKDPGYGREGGSEGLTHHTVIKNVSHLTAA